jgi:hypothetical protein
MKALIALSTLVLAFLVVVGAQQCGPNQWQCDNGNCIPESWVCDFWDDCGDNSDEAPNPNHPECPCPFKCNGTEECIPESWICDNYADCPEGDDEALPCPCPEGYIHCVNGECIKEEWWCDGSVHDCADHSDEDNCTSLTKERPIKAYQIRLHQEETHALLVENIQLRQKINKMTRKFHRRHV